jgi:hypothetical protein
MLSGMKVVGSQVIAEKHRREPGAPGREVMDTGGEME